MTPKDRTGLSRERILDAAEALVTERIPLTMRAIAERLDVTPMAIYKWFADKDEMLDALTQRLTPSPAAPPHTKGAWADRTMRFAVDVRRNLLEHLPLLQLDGAPRRIAINVFRSADAGLALMLELGYREQAAVDAYRVLFWSVLDHCMVIDAGGAMLGMRTPDEVASYVAGIAGEDFVATMPTFAAHLEWFVGADPDRFFEQAMRTVIAGIEAQAPQAHRSSRAPTTTRTTPARRHPR